MTPRPRYVLDETQVQAAVRLAEVLPSPRSRLPQPREGADAGSLSETGLLSPGTQQLSAEATTILGIAASPSRVVAVLTNVAGSPEWRETLVLRGAGHAALVAMSVADRAYELTAAADLDDAVALVDEAWHPAATGSPASAAPVTLPRHAYAALLASADALQSARWRARLARHPFEWRPVLSATVLQGELTRGCSTADTRWAVTASMRLVPWKLELDDDAVRAGLRALHEAGLVEPVSRGFAFTGPGLELASNLAELQRTVGLRALDGDGRPDPAPAGSALLQGVRTFLLADWSDGASGSGHVSVRQCSAAAARESVRQFLHGALGDASPAGTSALLCRRCGAGIEDPTANFCLRCGARVGAPEPSPRGPEPSDRGRPERDEGSVKEAARASAAARPAAADRTCPRCGRDVPATKKFCTGCGNRLG
jgi:hypothetical protein